MLICHFDFLWINVHISTIKCLPACYKNACNANDHLYANAAFNSNMPQWVFFIKSLINCHYCL